MVSSTQDWDGEDLAPIVIWLSRFTKLFWKLLVDALMRPGSIEVLDRGVKDMLQLLRLQDEAEIFGLADAALDMYFQ